MGAIHRVIPADAPGDVYWFHGASGSGKTKLAMQFEVLRKVILDADDLREVWSDLGFSKEDRWEQNTRLARLARLLSVQGFNVCVASICPYADLRRMIAKDIIPNVRWVFTSCRDSKPSSEEQPFEFGGWWGEERNR